MAIRFQKEAQQWFIPRRVCHRNFMSHATKTKMTVLHITESHFFTCILWSPRPPKASNGVKLSSRRSQSLRKWTTEPNCRSRPTWQDSSPKCVQSAHGNACQNVGIKKNTHSCAPQPCFLHTASRLSYRRAVGIYSGLSGVDGVGRKYTGL